MQAAMQKLWVEMTLTPGGIPGKFQEPLKSDFYKIIDNEKERL